MAWLPPVGSCCGTVVVFIPKSVGDRVAKRAHTIGMVTSTGKDIVVNYNPDFSDDVVIFINDGTDMQETRLPAEVIVRMAKALIERVLDDVLDNLV